MIKTLQYKFIRITMIAVFSVLLLIILSVNVVNIYRSNISLDSVTQIILKNGGTFRKNQDGLDKFKFDSEENMQSFDDRFHNKKELPFSTRYFTVTLDHDGNIISWDLSNIASVTEADIPEFTEKIMSGKNAVGWIGTYRYRSGETDGGHLLIIMEATNVRSSINSVFIITVLVGITAFLAVFILVALFSGRAIKPISETYEKQRQFITDASHELKTPLTVISANTEILSLTYGENEWCDGIERQTASMRNLIGQMIQMSKLDESKHQLSFERFHLSDAVYDTASAFRAPAEKNGLRMEIDVAPELYYSGDEGAIRQVISILTDNAVKYCDNGGRITIDAKKTKDFGKGHCRISIINSFEAVSSLDTDKIFERFYRQDPSRTDTHSYGLGLSIAKALIEQHGGKLVAVKRDKALEMRILL